MTTDLNKFNLLVYGPSGVGKTTQIEEFATLVYKLTGKATRLISRSGGGWQSIQPIVDSGILIPFDLTTVQEKRVGLFRLLCSGLWPSDLEDPLNTMQLPKDQDGWDDIGALAFESLTEIPTWIAEDVVEATQGQKKYGASDVQVTQTVGDDTHKFTGMAAGDYGFVQQMMQNWVPASLGIRGRSVMWTALESTATDDDGLAGARRAKVAGPEIIGNKLTPRVPAWFNHVLHLTMEPTGGPRTPLERRLYFERHQDAAGLTCVAKNTASRILPIAKIIGKSYLAGDDLSLRRFFELVGESQEAAAAHTREQLA